MRTKDLEMRTKCFMLTWFKSKGCWDLEILSKITSTYLWESLGRLYEHDAWSPETLSCPCRISTRPIEFNCGPFGYFLHTHTTYLDQKKSTCLLAEVHMRNRFFEDSTPYVNLDYCYMYLLQAKKGKGAGGGGGGRRNDCTSMLSNTIS